MTARAGANWAVSGPGDAGQWCRPREWADGEKRMIQGKESGVVGKREWVKSNATHGEIRKKKWIS